MVLGACALPSLPAWAQGAAKKRNVVIGHTGITWPARPFTGRRGGGPDAAAGGPPAGGAGAPAAPPAATGGTAACTWCRRRPARRRCSAAARSGDEPDDLCRTSPSSDLPDSSCSTGRSRGSKVRACSDSLVEKYKLPLVRQLHEHPADRSSPARAETIAAAVNVANIMKKYGGKTIVIGPSGRVGGPSYNFD